MLSSLARGPSFMARAAARVSPASTATRSYGSWAASASPHGIQVGSHGHSSPYTTTMYATTILSVRKDGEVAVVGDGQVTQGSQVVKPNARKVRRVGSGKVITGFAGATADALTLLDRLETKLDAHPGQLARSCVELAKDWRTERYLRHLEAVLLAVDEDISLTVTGSGDVIEPPDGIIAIGSGGAFALAAARALAPIDGLSAMDVCERAMAIAADMCVYTNNNFVKDKLPGDEAQETSSS